MPTKGQHKNHLEQVKLKQEEMEVYREKMELAIADYEVSKSDPATKETMQGVAKYWRVPLALLGPHVKGTREYKIDYCISPVTGPPIASSTIHPVYS